MLKQIAHYLQDIVKWKWKIKKHELSAYYDNKLLKFILTINNWRIHFSQKHKFIFNSKSSKLKSQTFVCEIVCHFTDTRNLFFESPSQNNTILPYSSITSYLKPNIFKSIFQQIEFIWKVQKSDWIFHFTNFQANSFVSI